MSNSGSGLPVEKAASELGVPSDALRLYVAAHKLADPSSATISAAEVDRLKEELRTRAGALRLDDLSKTALTIEWLAEAAVAAARDQLAMSQGVSRIEDQVKEVARKSSSTDLSPVTKRLEALEEKGREKGNASVQMVGNLQGMLETQGRELDSMRAEQLSLRAEISGIQNGLAQALGTLEAVEHRLEALIKGLQAAVGAAPPLSSANAAPESPPAQPSLKAQPVGAAEPKTVSEPKAEPPDAAAGEKTEPKKAANIPAAKPAKVGTKREIEYNFLLERMGYKRLDGYKPNEPAEQKVAVPTDDEIRTFLGKYEMGCADDEIEMVAVQRGEFLMVQYQRVEKASGLRNWIPRGKK